MRASNRASDPRDSEPMRRTAARRRRRAIPSIGRSPSRRTAAASWRRAGAGRAGRRAATIRTRQQRKRPRRAAPRVASLAEPQIRTLVSRELPMANENLAGRSIAGYRLLERVGEGGTAEVYRAEHAERGACAFKVLRQRLRGDPTVVKRFLREAGYGSRVKHPGVVRTYDFGEADGLYYLALEWAKGEPLADFLHHNAPLAPADAVALARQLADAPRSAGRPRPARLVSAAAESAAQAALRCRQGPHLPAGAGSRGDERAVPKSDRPSAHGHRIRGRPGGGPGGPQRRTSAARLARRTEEHCRQAQ